jgi:hypothetical protein
MSLPEMHQNLYETKNDEEYDESGRRGEELAWAFIMEMFLI